MFKWFQEVAPIRMKFRVLVIVLATLAAMTAITAILAIEGVLTSHLASLASAVLAFSGAGIVYAAGRVICRPYVDTVVRMEGLAAGDLDTPVAYTQYQDCVGRLTRAMATFRQQAIDLTRGAEQERAVATVAESLRRLASNDLTARMTTALPAGYDTLRDNFNQAAAALEQALHSVASAAGDIHTGSSEIRAASEDLSRRTEQQAAALEESSASIADVSSTVQRNAEAAQSAALSVREVQSEAREGGLVVARAVDAMTTIQKSSDEIAQIIGVIDGIAFQTNLLALNAGVEAARAGESGKGFAVVANEVRALAQRSAEAASQIRTLISSSSQQVTDGVALVGATGEALSSIMTRIDAVAASVDEIATSAAQQSTSLSHVSNAAHDMDRMTQQNAAMVEQTSAAARQLADQSVRLRALVDEFRVSNSAPAAAVMPVVAHSRPAPRRTPTPTPSATSGQLALAMPNDEWADF